MVQDGIFCDSLLYSFKNVSFSQSITYVIIYVIEKKKRLFVVTFDSPYFYTPQYCNWLVKVLVTYRFSVVSVCNLRNFGNWAYQILHVLNYTH